jgi:hypothetical protein
MIEYQTKATFAYGTNVRPEAGLEKDVRRAIKHFINQKGIDAFLDELEYEDVTEAELSEEEVEALYQDEELLIPVDKFKEVLTAVSLGLMELEGITKEQAIEALKNL